MSSQFVSHTRLPHLELWSRISEKRIPLQFELELTARCNYNCRHCYINLPAGDVEARKQELSADEIAAIAGQAVELGSVWCAVTGGEPTLRPDFAEIYLSLKKKGLLVSVLTNGSTVTPALVSLFQKYPPRDIEVTVYGATAETYESVTRQPGSFAAFQRGLSLLSEGGVKFRLKAMALRSNIGEWPAIVSFGRAGTKDYFRFDPLLNLRYDGDAVRNQEIQSERLTAEQIADLERTDGARSEMLLRNLDYYVRPSVTEPADSRVFGCGAGRDGFSISYSGLFRLCSSLNHPECVYDLRHGSLFDAWTNFVPRVREIRSGGAEYGNKCLRCPVINLCHWCPAVACLETGRLDGWSDQFCQVAHARAANLQMKK